MGQNILNGDSRASVKIEKDGDHKVSMNQFWFSSLITFQNQEPKILLKREISKKSKKEAEEYLVFNFQQIVDLALISKAYQLFLPDFTILIQNTIKSKPKLINARMKLE